MSAFRVFVGWEASQDEAFEVCKFSIERRSSIPVDVQPIDLADLRAAGLYARPDDPLASTEFTYSRFLTPALTGYSGTALYCDCDFLWLGDILELVLLADRTKAVQCVKHDHRPSEATKMDGKPQSAYPRKNWSSLMLFNCEHPSVRALTPDVVNRQTAAYLHRMQWARDEDIGALPPDWNWLEGWNAPPAGHPPRVVHFTRGGPWHAEWKGVAYADLWLDERDAMEAERYDEAATAS